MSKRVLFVVAAFAVILVSLVVFNPAWLPRFFPRTNDATITVKPGADDVEMINLTEPLNRGENRETQSPHAPVQVQGEVPENPGKNETKSK